MSITWMQFPFWQQYDYWLLYYVPSHGRSFICTTNSQQQDFLLNRYTTTIELLSVSTVSERAPSLKQQAHSHNTKLGSAQTLRSMPWIIRGAIFPSRPEHSWRYLRQLIRPKGWEMKWNPVAKKENEQRKGHMSDTVSQMRRCLLTSENGDKRV